MSIIHPAKLPEVVYQFVAYYDEGLPLADAVKHLMENSSLAPEKVSTALMDLISAGRLELTADRMLRVVPEVTEPQTPVRLSASAEKSAQQIPPDLAHWRYTVRRMDRKIAENVETRGKACSIALDKVLSSTRDVKQTTRQTREVMEEVRTDPMIRVLESEHKLLCWLREEAHYMCELNGGWA